MSELQNSMLVRVKNFSKDWMIGTVQSNSPLLVKPLHVNQSFWYNDITLLPNQQVSIVLFSLSQFFLLPITLPRTTHILSDWEVHDSIYMLNTSTRNFKNSKKPNQFWYITFFTLPYMQTYLYIQSENFHLWVSKMEI